MQAISEAVATITVHLNVDMLDYTRSGRAIPRNRRIRYNQEMKKSKKVLVRNLAWLRRMFFGQRDTRAQIVTALESVDRDYFVRREGSTGGGRALYDSGRHQLH